MSRTELQLKAGISNKALAKLGKDENVNTEFL
jgi:DNA-binding Xre family transcriptional regulator